MLLTMDDLSSPLDISSDELTWLQASEILGEPPAPPPKDDEDIFMEDLSFSSSLHSSSSPHAPRYILTPPTPILDSPASSKRAASLCSTPPRGTTRPNDSPRSEWIYRRPRSPVNGRHRPANPNPYPRPLTGYTKQTPILLARSTSSATTLTTRVSPMSSSKVALDHDSQSISSSTPTMTSSSGPFWSTVLRPRSRSERSIPLLKTIPSESQIILTPLDISPPSNFSTPKRISAPKSMSARPPSISSTVSSISNSPSPSSSRSESPVTPVSLSSSPYSGNSSGNGNINGSKHRRQSQSPYARRHRTHPDSDSSLPPLSHSCPPSKSILTRTSSVSTKGSSHTVNKSVKFAAIPTVHYASRGYWDMETYDDRDGDMGINIDGMDVDDPFAGYHPHDHHHHHRGHGRGGAAHQYHQYHDDDETLDIAKLRELQCTTPTPEREKEKAKGLKRLMSLSRKPVVPTTGTSTNVAVAHKLPVPLLSSASHSPSTSPRPVISTPYPLGTFSGAQPMQSTASLRSSARTRRAEPGTAGSVLDLPLSGGVGGGQRLRTAPSCESFRSSKSAAARSVRSLGSVKSTSSTRGFRAWLGRTVGWAES